MSAGPLMHSQLGQALNSPQLNHPNAMSQAHHYPQHSLQPQSHHPPLPATTSLVFKNSLENSTTGSGNVTSNALDIGSISPFGSKNGANFLGNSTFDLKRKALTGEAGIGGAMGSSNDNGLSNTASNALGGEMIPNVLSNHHLDQLSSTGSQSYPPSAVSRAISNNQNSNLDNVNRKERKRKRPDTNDSLMPPPTSTGYVPPTSGQDHLDHSLSVVGSPALRPITLNVKPVANANAIMINNSGMPQICFTSNQR